MNKLTVEDREVFLKSLREYLLAKAPEREVRAVFDSAAGMAPADWRDMVENLGVAGLLVPERFGGLGLGYEEAVLLLEEAAASLYCGPILSAAILAPTAIMASADEAALARYLPRIASGEAIAAVAHDDDPQTPAQALLGSDHWLLNGAKTGVIDAPTADLFLVIAQTEGGETGLFAMEREAAGLDIVADDVFDRTRRQATLTLNAVKAVRLGGDFAKGAEAAKALGALAAAAEQVGVSQKALDIAVEYAKAREQFGKPIGSFQAIKHLCADMLVKVEMMRALVRYAARFDGSSFEALEAASVAKAYSSQAATLVAEALIQILGGMGFTWEHPAHLYLRRARALQSAFGNAAFHRQRIADLRRAKAAG